MTDIPLTERLFLFGNCNIVPDRYDDWQAAYDKLAEYVFENEPNTLTYYFGIPLEHAANPSRTDNMLAFEAYRSRDDLYNTHLKSEVMTTTFLPNAGPAMTTGLDLTHFRAVGGFLDTSGQRTECGLMHDTQIQCVDAAARAEVVGALRMLCAMVEARQGDGKGEVLTFLGMKSEDDETGVRIFARYKSREVYEEWVRGGLMLRFWEAVKPCVANMNGRAYAPNGKGWLWK
ncbi:Fc.00g106770.m01.CDS01 [Cosmosporella sp. VM-42]